MDYIADSYILRWPSQLCGEYGCRIVPATQVLSLILHTLLSKIFSPHRAFGVWESQREIYGSKENGIEVSLGVALNYLWHWTSVEFL